MKYRIIITPEAESDLRKAYSYIRKHDAPLAARKWITGARKEIKTLANSPHRTPLAPEAHAFREPIRELLFTAKDNVEPTALSIASSITASLFCTSGTGRCFLSRQKNEVERW